MGMVRGWRVNREFGYIVAYPTFPQVFHRLSGDVGNRGFMPKEKTKYCFFCMHRIRGWFRPARKVPGGSWVCAKCWEKGYR